MIVRDQPTVFKLLFSWRGTILPKVLPPLGVVMLMSAIIGGLSHIGYFHFPELPLRRIYPDWSGTVYFSWI